MIRAVDIPVLRDEGIHVELIDPLIQLGGIDSGQKSGGMRFYLEPLIARGAVWAGD